MRVRPPEVDPLNRGVWLHGELLHPSKKEFALLRALAAEPTRVFTREELPRGVWGFRAIRTRRRCSYTPRAALNPPACRLLRGDLRSGGMPWCLCPLSWQGSAPLVRRCGIRPMTSVLLSAGAAAAPGARAETDALRAAPGAILVPEPDRALK
jgi:Transcriptional regulatory protein, C terminal